MSDQALANPKAASNGRQRPCGNRQLEPRTLDEQREAILSERPDLVNDNQGFIRELLRRRGVKVRQ